MKKDKPGQHPKTGRTQKRPIVFDTRAVSCAARQTRQREHAPQRRAAQCKACHGRPPGQPAHTQRRNKQRAQQRPRGKACMDEIHAFRALPCMRRDKRAAGVQRCALGHAHQCESGQQRPRASREDHCAVTQRRTARQHKNGAPLAPVRGQHARGKARRKVAHAQHGQQQAAPLVAQAVPFLQKRHHHSAAAGAHTIEQHGRICAGRLVLPQSIHKTSSRQSNAAGLSRPAAMGAALLARRPSFCIPV